MDFETQKTTETQKALPSAVSKDVLKKLFAVADIPQFEEYSVFETSDFFKNNYQIDTTMKSHWIDNLDTQKPVKKWGNGGKQIDYLGSIPDPKTTYDSEKIQKILIALGYLHQSHFSVTQEQVDAGQVDETDISYIGFLGNNERRAIQQFQSDQIISKDGIVGQKTKAEFYKQMFYRFHHTSKITQKTRMELEKLKK